MYVDNKTTTRLQERRNSMANLFVLNRRFIYNGLVLGPFQLRLRPDRSRDRWICPNPVEAVEGNFTVELHGVEILECAKASTGFWHAEAMFRDQDKIPPGCKGHIMLVFPEIWRNQDDGCDYRFQIYYLGGEWNLQPISLETPLDSRHRIVVLRT